eukprot:scaffold7176_cov134-Cylindrotheca_fusiformis.AAC.7
MNSTKVASFFSLLLLLVQCCDGDNIELDWFIPSNDEGFPDEIAEPGDTVIFKYGGNHDVYIHPSGNCSKFGAIQVGAQSEGAASYTFTESEVDTTVFFACDYINHCEFGQFIRFNIVDDIAAVEPSSAPSNNTVAPSEPSTSSIPIDLPSDFPSLPETTSPNSAAPISPSAGSPAPSPPTSAHGDEIELDWYIPSSGERLPDQTVEPGDTVIFTYTAMHNVYIHPTGNCSESGSILVGAQGARTASYTFTESEAGTTVFFACDYGSHCEFGQFIRFNVQEIASMEPSGAPSNSTMAPSAAPSAATMSPTAMPVLPPSVIELAGVSGNYTNLLATINTTDARPILEAATLFTIFGPTDGAFAAKPDAILGLSTEQIVPIMSGHVVKGAFTSSVVVAAGCVELTTLAGTELGVLYDGMSIFVNGIPVVEPDLVADDGVLHGIDGIIFDGSFVPCPSSEPSTNSVPIDLPTLMPSDLPSLPAANNPSSAASASPSAGSPATTEPTPRPPTDPTDRSQDASSSRKMMTAKTAGGLAVAMLSLM